MTKEIIGVEEWNNGLVIRYQVVVLTVELIQHNPSSIYCYIICEDESSMELFFAHLCYRIKLECDKASWCQ